MPVRPGLRPPADTEARAQEQAARRVPCGSASWLRLITRGCRACKLCSFELPASCLGPCMACGRATRCAPSVAGAATAAWARHAAWQRLQIAGCACCVPRFCRFQVLVENPEPEPQTWPGSACRSQGLYVAFLHVFCVGELAHRHIAAAVEEPECHQLSTPLFEGTVTSTMTCAAGGRMRLRVPRQLECD